MNSDERIPLIKQYVELSKKNGEHPTTVGLAKIAGIDRKEQWKIVTGQKTDNEYSQEFIDAINSAFDEIEEHFNELCKIGEVHPVIEAFVKANTFSRRNRAREQKRAQMSNL